MSILRRREEEPTQAQPKSQCTSDNPILTIPQPCKEYVRDAEAEWLEAFETDFWREYPRKVCKFMARKAFLKVKPWTQETCDAIFAGLDRWNKYWSDNEIERQYIPHPGTWLNQHRWEDDPNA